MNKIELLCPAGSLANLKAAVSKGADAVYLGMNRFSARDYATNFNEKYLKEAVNICKSNNVKAYLTMNILVKNSELRDFFKQLSYAYSLGIDAVIIQEISFLELIKRNYPDLRVHISTQAGVMNSLYAKMISKADRITLARELTKEEIKGIKESVSNELEIFCHGALCVSISGQCLFSSLLGGRSGNRGKCAQPCRKKYHKNPSGFLGCQNSTNFVHDGRYLLSTKELNLIERLPEIISTGVNAIKIEGRMRTPYYVATTTETYRKAIDSFYSGNFKVNAEMIERLEGAFTREFTNGWFDESEDIFNREKGTGVSKPTELEKYEVKSKEVKINRDKMNCLLPEIKKKESDKKRLLVRVYNKKDAISASLNGADIVYYDLFADDFNEVKEKIKCKLFAVTPKIMLDEDVDVIKNKIIELKPDGVLAGNLGMLNLGLDMPIHLDYNLNCFNDIDLGYYLEKNSLPIISPELSLTEMAAFKNKNFIAFVHGKIRLMTLRHELSSGWVKDEKGGRFGVNKIFNGCEVINEKELGLLGKSSQLLNYGINNFFIDTEENVSEVVKIYRDILDGKKVDDSKLKKKYVLGWAFRGVE